jgi:glycosyltransferase involved in cell wall biosynthesis
MVLLYVSLVLIVAYAIIQFQYIRYWHALPKYGSPTAQLTPVTIIVVVRNGANVINRCLAGILHQHYPAHLFEIIVIDDHSTDQTAAVVRGMHDTRIHLIALSDFPEYHHPPAFKKSAIALGVDLARNDTIIVTDADCLHPPAWLKSIVHHFEISEAVFQTGPVLLLPKNNMLVRMQEMELLGLMLITGSGIQSRLHDLSNGANMAFSKEAFLQVNGYDGNWHHASGDDLFLAEKMRAAFPNQIAFAKVLEATVLTEGQYTWSALIRQRLRWSGKNNALRNKRVSMIWLVVGLYHIALLALLLCAVFHVFSWWPFLIMLTSKWICDLALLIPAVQFFKKESLLRYFVPLQGWYAVYVLRMGWAMITGTKTDWKRD